MSTDPTGVTSPTDAAVGVYPADVQAAFVELGRLMLDQPLGLYLQKVADLAAGTLPGVDGLSVTLVENGTARSAAFTSSVAAALDERQYESGFGPCLDAAQTGQTIRVDVDDDDIFRDFVRAARRHGVRAVASVGMPVPQQVVGALNLYSLGGDFDEDTLDLARTYASYSAVALANAALYGSTTRLAQQLQEAMRSRAVIEQAKGVLVAQLHLDPEDAFAHLAKASQDSNTKLRDLAVQVVARAQHGHLT